MNQILATSPQKKGKNNRKNYKSSGDIKSVVKVFAIVLAIFGIFMVGTGSYALYQEYAVKIDIPLKPTISVESREENTILLKVIGQKEISKVTYQWNEEEAITLNGNGGKYLEQLIEIPTGSNELTITAIDVDNQQNSFTNIYEIDSNIKIEALENGNIKISYQGDEEISYITYRWDEEDETRIDIDDTEFEEEIEAIKGKHKLTVIVVDINNKTETKVQEVEGVSKPIVEITTDDAKENFVVKATDESGITEILFTINEDPNQQYKVRVQGKTEFEFKYPLNEGENKIKVQVYNQDNVMTEKRVLFRK